MWKSAIVAIACVAPVALTGCNPVAFDKIVGTPIDDRVAESLNGEWQVQQAGSRSGALRGSSHTGEDDTDREWIRVTSLSNGQLRLSELDIDEKSDRGSREWVVIATRAGKATYVNVPLEQNLHDRDEARFRILRFDYAPAQKSFTLWTPSTDAFVAAVEQGKLKGNVIKGSWGSKSVYITASRDEIETFLDDSRHDALFEPLSEPIRATRQLTN